MSREERVKYIILKKLWFFFKKTMQNGQIFVPPSLPLESCPVEIATLKRPSYKSRASRFRRRPATVHVVPTALHARGRSVLRVFRFAVLRPTHAAVQAVPPVVPRVHRPRPVQLFRVHVPAASGPQELAVRFVLRPAAARRLLYVQRGHGRVPQLVARREATHVCGQRAGRGRGRLDRRTSGAVDRRWKCRCQRHSVRLLGRRHVRVRLDRFICSFGEYYN